MLLKIFIKYNVKIFNINRIKQKCKSEYLKIILNVCLLRINETKYSKKR